MTPFLPGGAWSPGRRQTGENEILSAGKGLLSKAWRQRGSWPGFVPGTEGPGKDGWSGDPPGMKAILARSRCWD